MRELPSRYPDLDTFRQVSNLIAIGAPLECEVSSYLVTRVRSIMTPQTLLQKNEFARPYVITSKQYIDFDSLLENRDRIRRLTLVPIKTQEEYDYYHSFTAQELAIMAEQYVLNVPLAIEPNHFPYDLPQGVEQAILWIRDPNCSSESLAEFIARYMTFCDLKIEDVILFERPFSTKTPLVRGSVPSVRHIHLWSRIKS